MDPDDAELIRIGENAVFRLTGSRVVVRIGRDDRHHSTAEVEVRTSRWLADEGVPAVRALEFDQPVSACGRVVTFWESVGDRAEYGTPAELGTLLRQLHALNAPPWLPSFDPFTQNRDRLAASTGLGDADHSLLLSELELLHDEYKLLNFALAPGVVHGDASVGNAFRTRNGAVVLGDLDGFAVGNREWDLVQTAMYADSFGWHTEAEYGAFVEAYGFDVRSWSGYLVMRNARELMMVIWLAQNAADPSVAAELAKRLHAVRTGASRRDWVPF
ncbi:aminoglycoside phosphotransferase (APT) family kinase protein [Allocatelliglobosispora scoriae]|uniref:Aminoglycoside phosphotransferase (APT) family kinase protein n=1 Tax=Allocatelliglobosispora scoriae TaxID=643052 RepID=A0A841BLP1_9ACTN|nr:aminoglycoside phosphotransferase family protein [Allocatelliglobosispora scoriae]MBB5868565.1 aminoglycoside phosphotransferase (APT) family kinase protein [Allocatelliglobosispora scoriae]